MIVEVDRAAKLFAAHGADGLLPGFFPGVDPQVVLECAGVAAALAAGLADVRPLSSVSEHVMLQGTAVTAGFTANLAGEKLLSGDLTRAGFDDVHVAASCARPVPAEFLLHVSHPVSSQ